MVKALHEGIRHVELIEHPAIPGRVEIRVHTAQDAPGSRALWATEICAAVVAMAPAGVEVAVELHPFYSREELDLVARVQAKVRALWGNERGHDGGEADSP